MDPLKLFDTQEVAGSIPARPTLRSPRFLAGGFVVGRRSDRKAAVDGVRLVLPERAGDVLVAVQHGDVLMPEHVQVVRGRHPPGRAEASRLSAATCGK